MPEHAQRWICGMFSSVHLLAYRRKFAVHTDVEHLVPVVYRDHHPTVFGRRLRTDSHSELRVHLAMHSRNCSCEPFQYTLHTAVCRVHIFARVLTCVSEFGVQQFLRTCHAHNAQKLEYTFR